MILLYTSDRTNKIELSRNIKIKMSYSLMVTILHAVPAKAKKKPTNFPTYLTFSQFIYRFCRDYVFYPHMTIYNL